MAVVDVPVPGEVVYRWSWWRYLVTVVTISFTAAVVAWLFGSLVFSALEGRPGGIDVITGATYVVGYTFFFTFFSSLAVGRRPAGLRFGAAEIELAAARCDVVVVPWAAVTSARVRWFWPIAMLDVFVPVADESQVTRVDRDGRRPLRKRKGDRLRFSVPLAGLSPAAEIKAEIKAEITAELRRRGLTATPGR